MNILKKSIEIAEEYNNEDFLAVLDEILKKLSITENASNRYGKEKRALLNFEWVKAFHRGNIVRKCCLLQDNISIKNGHGKLVFCSTWH